jgi:hypothetical protein
MKHCVIYCEGGTYPDEIYAYDVLDDEQIEILKDILILINDSYDMDASTDDHTSIELATGDTKEEVVDYVIFEIGINYGSFPDQIEGLSDSDEVKIRYNNNVASLIRSVENPGIDITDFYDGLDSDLDHTITDEIKRFNTLYKRIEGDD